MSSVLPPGCRFFPSDEQLLCYYLTNKNRTIEDSNDNNQHRNNNNDYDLIRELDLYEYQPFGLPGNVCYAYGNRGRKRHWYCYTKIRVLKESNGAGGGEKKRMRIKAKGGFWRRNGNVRDVLGPAGKVVVGTRAKFVFYLGDSVKSAVKTDWFLYEYALVDNVKDSFVLCRVFAKSRAGNSTSENILSSCNEGSVFAVCHVGVQHDGFLTPDSAEDKLLDDNPVDGKKDLSRCPVKPSTEPDNQLTLRPVSVAPSPSPLGFQSNDLVTTSRHTSGDMSAHAETGWQLQSVTDEDFIELDDLID